MAELRLDWIKIGKAREAADSIAGRVTEELSSYTTVTVERAVCRLLGIDGVDRQGVPLANVVVDDLLQKGLLNRGAAYWLAQGALSSGLSPAKMAEALARDQFDFPTQEKNDSFACRLWAEEKAREAVGKIRQNRRERQNLIGGYGERPAPWMYAIVATGNIYEDMVQAKAAARQGADVIAVIRTLRGDDGGFRRHHGHPGKLPAHAGGPG